MKIVISGGPCSGKSSIINALKDRGHNILTESAREVIKESGLNHNMTIDESIMLQTKILERQVIKELPLEGLKETYFLDSGCIDCYGFYRHLAKKTLKYKPGYDLERYALIFTLDSLPFIKDDVRREDGDEAVRLNKIIIEEYKKNEYEPLHVPVMDIEDRIDYILSVMDEKFANWKK